MRSVEEHLTAILDAIEPLRPVGLPLLEAAGAVLAEPVTAPTDLPPFDNSAMDGYAVRAADLAALAAAADPPGPVDPAGPATAAVSLPVTADIAAGDQGPHSLAPGACARIMTGAPMPAGADAVVPVEWTDGDATRVRISRPAEPGRYVRRRGEDVTAGQVVLEPGTLLGAAQLGLCAAVGRDRVVVRPPPRVVVLSTGSELVQPGRPIGPGQIWDSNSYMLTLAAAEAGFSARRHGIVDDTPAEVLAVIEDQVRQADAIITSGGVSMGVHDVVKEVLARLGTVRFDKVAMRPGKPQGFGTVGEGTPIFTLPGNPVSAYVSFEVFVRPALRKMQGLAFRPRQTVRATLTAPVSSPAGIRHFLRAGIADRNGRREVTPVEGQGSHQLAALVAADGLIVVPESETALAAGTEVEVVELPGR